MKTDLRLTDTNAASDSKGRTSATPTWLPTVVSPPLSATSNMKSQISLLISLAATVAFAETPEAIQRVTLDESVVVTVPVATNRVTTISFPGPIAAIDAVGVTADGKTPEERAISSLEISVTTLANFCNLPADF